MKSRSSARFVMKCPYFASQDADPNSAQNPGSPKVHPVVRKGFYRRSSDSQWITRYFCKNCERSFSSARLSACFNQKKRRLNEPFRKLLCSGVSLRRAARILRCNRKTTVRKLLFLASQAGMALDEYLRSIVNSEPDQKVKHVVFDEMETFEKSKCLPLSIALAVEDQTRKVLGFEISSMPANGPLALISRRKYGLRADDRARGAALLFQRITPLLCADAKISSDQNPKYPTWIKRDLPKGIYHYSYKGRRGCVVGQGELKRGGFDPLFSLNHTAAMFRANVNRLFRRTWCTTKRMDRLAAHLAIYVQYHNEVLTQGR